MSRLAVRKFLLIAALVVAVFGLLSTVVWLGIQNVPAR
jgi:hypothetical protein